MDNIKRLIKENKLIDEGEVIGVGVSGGKDSMALLHYLKKLSHDIGFEVVAITVDHSIREESATDAMFVSDFCRANRIRCYKFKIDVPNLAKEKGLSLESAAREARYGVFESLISKNIVDKIALAHHKSDQAETVLLHLIRGAGISGLKGMQVKRDVYIRPMLETSQKAVLDYLNDNYIDYVEDKTNAESEFARNYIRNEVMPVILKKFPNAVEAMMNFANLAKQDNDYITQTMPTDAFIVEDKTVKIPLSYFIYHKSVVARMIFKALSYIGVNSDIESKHIEQIYELAKTSENGKKIELPAKVVAIKEYDYLTLICKQKEIITLNQPFEVGECKISGVGKIVVKRTKNMANDGALYVDAKALPKDVAWRFRENGDVFEKFGGGTKKLKSYLIDIKLPARQRTNLPVLCSGNEVYVIAGVEISDKVKITENTGFMYRIEFIKE
ncbi:MAG: tRNA lysidine(34) synthetase TilS [Clostridia bacterium]|nr:tRNA lysidine(34) synthetase TilS [Clostridia bacterium]